jgi:hypothetical protein
MALGHRTERCGDLTATPEVIALLAPPPVFCDVDARSFNMDPAALPAAIETAKNVGLTPRVITPVDLFGQPPTATPSYQSQVWIAGSLRCCANL